MKTEADIKAAQMTERSPIDQEIAKLCLQAQLDMVKAQLVRRGIVKK